MKQELILFECPQVFLNVNLHETNYFCNIGDKIRYFCLKNLTKLMLLINKFIDRYNN